MMILRTNPGLLITIASILILQERHQLHLIRHRIQIAAGRGGRPRWPGLGQPPASCDTIVHTQH